MLALLFLVNKPTDKKGTSRFKGQFDFPQTSSLSTKKKKLFQCDIWWQHLANTNIERVSQLFVMLLFELNELYCRLFGLVSQTKTFFFFLSLFSILAFSIFFIFYTCKIHKQFALNVSFYFFSFLESKPLSRLWTTLIVPPISSVRMHAIFDDNYSVWYRFSRSERWIGSLMFSKKRRRRKI